MLIIFIVIVLYSYIKYKKKYSIYEAIGALFYIKIKVKIKKYQTLKNLRFMCTREEFEINKILYIYKKIFCYVISTLIIYYILKYISNLSVTVIFYLLFMIVMIINIPDYKLSESCKEKREIINSNFPKLITKLNLLMGSGMASIPALKKITINSSNIFEESIKVSIMNIETGESIENAFYELSKKCQNVNVTQFVRIIIQDRKHGSSITIKRLNSICEEVWKIRKVEVLKKGEEASTKLLLPMMVSLVSILIAVIIPAIYQLFKIY